MKSFHNAFGGFFEHYTHCFVLTMKLDEVNIGRKFAAALLQYNNNVYLSVPGSFVFFGVF